MQKIEIKKIVYFVRHGQSEDNVASILMWCLWIYNDHAHLAN